MIRKYSLVVEGEAGSYSAYVLELPTILVTGTSMEELKSRAQEAVVIHWETLNQDRSPTSTLCEIEVDAPEPDPGPALRARPGRPPSHDQDP